MLKRDLIKYVRDKAKSGYKKADQCRICGGTSNLELHHYNGLTALLDRWIRTNNLSVKTEEDILSVRNAFIAQHTEELYEKVVTLCKPHHARLHEIYGKDPGLGTATKQEDWVEKQRAKTNSKVA